ncbi:MAG: DoxX family protein [Bacteroidetes bacterium]|nr:DoxX family protein [Bacteroidota bacterium]
MTLTKLILIIGIAAILLTLLTVVMKKQKNILMTFAQHFTGALFVFSGWVKAVDPLGTAYKMEQYFAEFEATFSGTWFSFLAPMFPWLSEYSTGFSVFMIIFEIALGIMLILGSRPKFTSWAFFLLVAFFTVLTGFTYLTGYVPSGENFFNFSAWGAYDATSMRVTDCGCFGDFIKLEPRTSFLKDVFLLIPAIFFIWKHKYMHQLFSQQVRFAVVGLGIIALFFYCRSNYKWDLPHTDFRPFKEGVNVAEQKQIEMDAQETVQVVAYKITNKESGETVELSVDDYLKRYKEFPKDAFELEQVKTEPEMEPTKISDFEFSDLDGNEATEAVLEHEGYHFMIVSYKIPHESETTSTMVMDTTWMVDTVMVNDTLTMKRRPGAINERQVNTETYSFPEYFTEKYKKLNAELEKAEAAGVAVHALTGYAAPEMIDDFRHETQSAYPFYVADDILLKTIVRSNPGVVLMDGGKIIAKWHIRKLPSFEEIQAEFLK